MGNIGIWMDKRNAIILHLYDEIEKVTTVISEIETYHVHGGSGSRLKGGPQDVVQDSKYLEREKHQFKQYAQNIVRHIKTADRIAIYGPAESGLKFHKYLKKKFKEIAHNVESVNKADSMTDNQIISLLKDHFKR